MGFFILKSLNSLLNLLNSEKAPSQLAAGLAFGVLVGLTPLMSLHNLVLLMIVFLFRVNLSFFFLSLGVVKILAWMLDPVFDSLGYWMLVDLESLRGFWISVTSGTLWPFFRFNNTVVIGSLVVGLCLWPFLFVGGMALIKQYRSRWRERMAQSKLMKGLKATPFYGYYLKYQSFREKMGILS
jgi:uncharacterized protein (TIGR03546 family)